MEFRKTAAGLGFIEHFPSPWYEVRDDWVSFFWMLFVNITRTWSVKCSGGQQKKKAIYLPEELSIWRLVALNYLQVDFEIRYARGFWNPKIFVLRIFKERCNSSTWDCPITGTRTFMRMVLKDTCLKKIKFSKQFCSARMTKMFQRGSVESKELTCGINPNYWLKWK